MNLRPYQNQAIEAVEAAYQRGLKSVLVTLPTGTGKTIIFCTLVKRRHEQDDRRPTLVLAHREELLTQAADKFRQVAPELRVGIERGDERAPRGVPVVVASVQTVGQKGSSRLEGFKPGLIVIDEAHHSCAAGYGIALERFAGTETQILGVTATAKRLDRQALHGHQKAVFQEVAFAYPIRQAIEDGYLVDIRGYRVQTDTDLSDVTTRNGDFAAGELAKKVDAPERTDAALKHWREVAGNRQTIAFCASVEHAHHVAEAFTEQGVLAEAVDGAMPTEQRRKVMGRFQRGQTQVLANCEIATEGFDVPQVGCVLLLRPTQSWALYVQMVGRGTRLAPGKKDLVVLDVVDSCARHSLATVPAILDLPPGLDLQGQSLAKAAQALETLGEKAAVLQKALPGNWAELQTLLTQVDLFSGLTTPQEVSGGRMRWLAIEDGYQVGCGEKRWARLRQFSVEGGEGWWVRLEDYDEFNRCRRKVATAFVGQWLETAVSEAEKVVLDHWPESLRLNDREAKWLSDPPSEGQLRWLRKMDVPEAALASLTKGEASALLDKLFAQGRSRSYARR